MDEITMWHQIGAALVGFAVVGNFVLNLFRGSMVERRLANIEHIFSDVVQRVVVLETRMSEHSDRHHREYSQIDNRIVAMNEKVNDNNNKVLAVLSDIRDRISRMEGAK